MGNYVEQVLTEEQYAAYLDGMLTPEESYMVEEIIASVPGMEEIQDAMDSIDSSYIHEIDNEVPIECLADDFVLPSEQLIYGQSEQIYNAELSDEYDETEGYQDELNNFEFQNESSALDEDTSFDNSAL